MESFSNNPYSLEELKELSLEADIYVNSAKRKKDFKSRVREVIPMLDEVARPLYLEQPVRVFGVHGRSKFDRGTGGTKVYMSAGQVAGISEGFSAVNFSQLHRDFSEGGDERHLRLIAELRERAIGDVGICHLVRRSIVSANRSDFLSSIHLINRAFAPVASSVLIPDTSPEITAEERMEELLRLVSVSRPETLEPFVRIQETLERAEDPLEGLSECAKDFNDICKRSDSNMIEAVHDYLNIVVGPNLFGSVYNFSDALPPLIVNPPEGGLEVRQFPPDDVNDLLFINLAIASDLVQEEGMIKMEGGQVLYAVAHLFKNGFLDPSTIFIPIEGLKNKNFRVLGRAVRDETALVDD